MDPDEEAALGLDPEVALKGWKRPVYMVHEHHARSLHWDLRLELDQTLKSWAVPKGLPPEPGVRRLAVEQPDHALSYAPFEGDIPEGEYGAGKVTIWDKGTFDLVERGGDKLVVRLKGERVQGEYHMVRAKLGGEPKNWLIFRGKGEGTAPGAQPDKATLAKAAADQLRQQRTRKPGP